MDIATHFMNLGNHLLATILKNEKTITTSEIIFTISGEVEKSLLVSSEKEILEKLASQFNIKGLKILIDLKEVKRSNSPKILTQEEIILDLKKSYPTFNLIAEKLKLTFI